nr:MAG TPA: hypothetical protein [Caudoviricetes sp.]
MIRRGGLIAKIIKNIGYTLYKPLFRPLAISTTTTVTTITVFAHSVSHRQ